MKIIYNILVLFCCLSLLSSCSTKKYKDLTYIEKATAQIPNPPKLNFFMPRKTSEEKLSVLIFVHGGNWNSGSKDQYGFFGRNFAKNEVITVIPDYTLSPAVSYDEMTQQTAAAIQWAKQHISEYNGDPNRIYVTGHSAGGHLVALATMNPKYGIDPKTISGIILNDSGGLDMFDYLQKKSPATDNNYITTWTNNPETWKEASPLYFIDENTPPILMYMGSKSYPFIKSSSRKFFDSLKPFQPNAELIVLPKKHVPMVIQYFFPWSNRFDEIVKFMETHP